MGIIFCVLAINTSMFDGYVANVLSVHTVLHNHVKNATKTKKEKLIKRDSKLSISRSDLRKKHYVRCYMNVWKKASYNKYLWSVYCCTISCEEAITLLDALDPKINRHL